MMEMVEKQQQAPECAVVLCSPGAKKMFRFKTGDADSPRAGPPTESPYLLSPVGRESPLGNTIVSPKRAPRKIARSPFKVCPGSLSCHHCVCPDLFATCNLFQLLVGHALHAPPPPASAPKALTVHHCGCQAVLDSIRHPLSHTLLLTAI